MLQTLAVSLWRRLTLTKQLTGNRFLPMQVTFLGYTLRTRNLLAMIWVSGLAELCRLSRAALYMASRMRTLAIPRLVVLVL
ncbi:hypothetical protein D3C84_1001990 [compost metagenome]